MSELTPRAETRRDATAEELPSPVLTPSGLTSPGLTSLQMIGATDADACTDGVCALPEDDA